MRDTYTDAITQKLRLNLKAIAMNINKVIPVKLNEKIIYYPGKIITDKYLSNIK